MSDGWLKRAYQRYMTRITLSALIAALIFLYFSPLMVHNIGPGQAGVLWRRFSGGTVLDEVLGQGVHVIWPWNRLFTYDLRLQSIVESYDVIAKDGLSLNVNINFRYHLSPASLPYVHDRVGEDYRNIVLIPLIGSKARSIISQYAAEELYTSRRAEVEQEIAAAIRYTILTETAITPETDSFLTVEDAMIKSVVLPTRVAEAIERKLIEYQYTLEYDFRLQREGKEAERKRIEAAGVNSFFNTLGPEQTNQYLRWRGIEATVQLARSPNAKSVIIGGNSSGVPIILGNADGPAVPPVPASAIGRGAVQGGSEPPYSVGRAENAIEDFNLSNEYPIAQGGPAAPVPAPRPDAAVSLAPKDQGGVVNHTLERFFRAGLFSLGNRNEQVGVPGTDQPKAEGVAAPQTR